METTLRWCTPDDKPESGKWLLMCGRYAAGEPRMWIPGQWLERWDTWEDEYGYPFLVECWAYVVLPKEAPDAED